MKLLRQNLLAAPGVLLSFLPLASCPACWPLYGGVLSALGLTFLLSSRYLLPLTAAVLCLALVSLAWRARSRRGYGPFGLGLLAAGLILGGKFAWSSNPLTYGGVALLVAASVWNSWPRQRRLFELLPGGCSCNAK